MSVRFAWGSVKGMVLVALRSLWSTFALMLLLGALLAGISLWHLNSGLAGGDRPSWVRAVPLVVAAIVFLECVLIGAALGVKRAIAAALAQAVRNHQFGRLAVGTVFDRLLRAPAAQAAGEHAQTSRAAERLPLADVEKRLHEAMHALLSDRSGEQSWVRRKLEGRLLGTVGRMTLARFRQAHTQRGGIDVPAVRVELETAADDWLVRTVSRNVNLWTVLVLVFLPLQVAVVDFLLLRLL